MNISEPFIRRPVATSLLMVGLLLAGILGYRALPVSALPQVDYPTIVVSTYLPGASAETMASAVTTPLERQFGQMPALNQMTSVSSFAISQITLQFNLDRDIDAAEQDVQAAMNAAANLLPRGLPSPPTYSKSNPADTPVLTLAVSSERVPLQKVNDYADSVLAQKISQIAGVGLVTLSGGQKPAVRVQADPAALASAGLSLEDVRQALVQANVNQPKGNIDGARQDYAIATNDQLDRAESFRGLVLSYRNGAALRLRDVADVIDGVENTQLAGWADDRRAVILNVQRQPGANVIEVAERVKALLPQLSASLPPGVEVRILSDRTETVRASVEDVEFTLVLTIGLVVAVIYVFLRSLRATLIPGVVVPLSIIGTFGVMQLFGYSLNNLSLMALTISTGFVVDDAIVVTENVTRHIEAGRPPLAAALDGAREIGFTIVSITVSLLAVFIPILLMGGIVGRLFREFAVTLSVAISVSAILSLTLTASLCAHLMTGYGGYALPGTLERAWDALLSLYGRALRVVLQHQRLTLCLLLLSVGMTVYLALLIPKGLLPLQDTGVLIGTFEAAADASFARTMERQRAVAEVLLADPAVATVASALGADGTNPVPNGGRMTITLKPHEQRPGIEAILNRLRIRLAAIPDAALYLQPVQDLQIDSSPSRTQFQYTIEDADADELARWAPLVLEKLRGLRELADVVSDQQQAGLRLDLDIDRDTAARLGVHAQAIDEILYDAFGQRQITTRFTQLNQYRVILEVKPQFQRSAEALRSLHVRSARGGTVPLASLIRFNQAPAPISIQHQGQSPCVTLSFNTAPGVALGVAVDAVERAVAGLALPGGVRAGFRGTAQQYRQSLASEPILIMAAILMVYIVLGVLYESYIHPLTILSTLPSAGVGAFLALLLCRVEFSLIALIGMVLLIGIVKKNAIMMIDFALKAEREQGVGAQEAIYRACVMRFRPITMTTMAALLGGLPLAVGSGVGAELRRPLGIAVIGGLILSQLMTLFTTPVVYLYMGRFGAWLRRRSEARQE